MKLTVNGKAVDVDVPHSTPLLWVLREEMGLTGTKFGCGKALCGYTLNASSNDKGEAVLINMKPKTDTRWAGSVYSKDSGDTYYGTVDLKNPDTLRVEACAFSRFYCSGNNWIRISTRPMITSRQVETRPRS